MSNTPCRLASAAFAVALLAVDVSAQLPVGPAPGRRGRDVAEDVARCFHRLSLAGDTCEEQAADFVARHARDLGTSPARVQLGPVRQVDVGRRRRRTYGLQEQRVHGFVVEGHGLTYAIDESGRIRSAHGVLSDRAADMPPPSLLPHDARALALGLQGLTLSDFRARPVVIGVARLVDGRLRLLQRVEGVTHDLVPLAIELDAYDGSLVRVFERRYDGKVTTGTHSYDGVDSTFDLGKAKGYRYKSMKHALDGKDNFTKLDNFAVTDSTPLVGEAGLIHGRFAQVFNADGLVVDQPSLEYPYADGDPTLVSGLISSANLFDHTNTYAWFDEAGTWIEKQLGDHPLDRTMPVYVNQDITNAYFSPSDPDGPNGFPGGFFVFGDFGDGLAELMHDFSRDPSIVVHEYVHGIVDGLGASFGDADADNPERAVNEALADYGAAAMLGDPKVGRVLVAYAGDALGLTGDSFRDLESRLTLQDDLFDVIGFTSGLPQEHAAGEIFGAFLWRARDDLKKDADETILVDMLAWPQSAAEVGFPDVTPANAGDAYEAFYFGCVEASIDGLLAADDGSLAKRQKKAGAVLGAALAHGLAGQTDANTYVFDATEGLKLKLGSEFLGTHTSHTLDLALSAGQQVSILAKGRKGTAVDATLTGGSFTLDKGKKTNKKGTLAKYPKVQIDATDTYRLVIESPDEPGEYTLKIKVK